MVPSSSFRERTSEQVADGAAGHNAHHLNTPRYSLLKRCRESGMRILEPLWGGNKRNPHETRFTGTERVAGEHTGAVD